MRKLIAAVALTLFGCHYGPASGDLASPTSYVATYSKQFQIDVGRPLIFITYFCHGDTVWSNTRGLNVNHVSPPDGDIKIAAYCANGFGHAFPNDAPS